jgi:metal-responsive CopG/Arc/MetJ family transcriptional regulator
MLTVQLPDHLAKRLQEIAERENRSINELVTSLVEESIAPDTSTIDESVDPFDAIDGILDYDITDMSTTVKETMREYFRKKYGGID